MEIELLPQARARACGDQLACEGAVRRLGNSAIHVQNVNACQRRFISWGDGALPAHLPRLALDAGWQANKFARTIAKVAIRVITS
jgi:hypothetical protein